MNLTSWLTTIGNRSTQPRRRRQDCGYAASAIVETLELRKLLSAAPVISNLGPTANYTEGAPPVIVAPQATVTDSASSYALSTLTVKTTNAISGDHLGVVNGHGVAVGSDGSVLYASSSSANPVLIGTVSGGAGSVALTVSFNQNATQTSVQAVLDQVAYGNGTSTLAIPDRVISLTFTDGDGVASAAVTKSIHVTPAPVVANLAKPLVYTEGAPPEFIEPMAKVGDAAGAFANSSLTVAINNGIAGDQLGIVNGAGIGVGPKGAILYKASATDNPVQIGTMSGGSGSAPLVLQFNANATQASVQAALDQVVYGNGTSTFAIPDRQLTIVFTDGNHVSSVPVHQGIHVNPAPVVNDLGAPVVYKEGAPPLQIAATAKINDAPNAYANSSLSVKINNGLAGDQLGIGTGDGISLGLNATIVYKSSSTATAVAIGTVKGGSGSTPLVVQFNANATQASVQAVLNEVIYGNGTSTLPTPDRQVSIVFTDGNKVPSVPAVQGIHVVPAPVIGHVGAQVNYQVNANPVALAPTATISDAAGAFANSKLTVQLGGSAAGDQLGIQANGALTLGTGDTLLYNGVLIGAYTSGSGSTALVITFNAKATAASVNEVLDNITFSYNTTSTTPVLTTRHVGITFTDGNKITSAEIIEGIHVTK